MSRSFTHTVPQDIPAQRIQEYGVGLFDLIPTKSALKKAIKKEQITVNGCMASTATFIQGGELIVFTPKENPQTQRTFNLQLEVLFEDDFLAAIHKPAGVLVSGNDFKTVVNALPENLESSQQEDAVRPKPTHRLDFATTGILLIGKTAESIRRLAKLFENKHIEKSYYAVTIGSMESEGIIEDLIDGKSATSHFEVVRTLESPRFEKLNLVKLTPKTGRRHQLRKHLAGQGNPILGDRDYSPEHLVLKGKGMYLHAFSLEFIHPFTGQKLSLADPLPKRFTKLFPEY